MKENTQLSFPYEVSADSLKTVNNSLNINAGQSVVYIGDILGGPVRGEFGTIKRLYGTKAVVDLGLSGVWNVPYYLLAKEFAA